MNKIKFLLSILPFIIELIGVAEKHFPGKKAGIDKLMFVKSILETVAEETKEHWMTIEKAISVIVEFFNKGGLILK